MLKRHYFAVATAILISIKLSSAYPDVTSTYADAVSSSDSTPTLAQSTSFTESYGEKHTTVCEQNEVYDDCIEDNCKAETCSQLGYPLECKNSESGSHTEGCVCRDGYLRSYNGTCIPAKSCPSCGGDVNAECGCGINCNRHCSNIGQETEFCLALCKDNACDCKEGFYYDDNIGRCVLPESCTAVCGLNEIFSDCVQGHCGPKNCSQLDTALPCPFCDPNLCIEGCVCKDNYIRDDNGICILKNKCPPTCGINEIYTKCIENDCKAWSCSQIGFPLDCTTSQTDICTEGCACKDGYLRDDIGTCVSNKLCPSCGGDINAEYGCGLNCNKHCCNIGKEPESCIAICYNNACDCKDGFYFDDNIGKCVLPEQCTPACGQNEVYANYTEGECKAFNCSQLGFPLECSHSQTSISIEGCICKDGYLRADNGSCIPNICCPSCGGDPNAEPGCGVNCNKHCYNIGKEPESCIVGCYENACDCKDGFFLDDNIRKCVLPNQCTPVCGKNEKYINSTESECKPFNCSQLGFPLQCSNSQANNCTDGCVCEDGYLRDDNGICIPTTACPSCGGDPYAKSGCGVNCNKHCYNIDTNPEICIDVCYENACDCNDGYYFDDNIGRCVLPEQCALSLTITSASSTSTVSAGQNNIEGQLAKFHKGNLALTGELLYQLVQSKPGASFVGSALSALIPFAELALYAYGLTLEQLLNLINLENKDQIRQSFPILLKKFQSQETVRFEVASKFYGNHNYPLSDTFKQEALNVFNNEGENIDFINAKQAADVINKWVASKTNNLIENLILPDTLNNNTELICVSALYFLGNWKHQFNPNSTKNRDFYVSANKMKSVPTMYQQAAFNYNDDKKLNAQIIELDYKGGNFSCVIWLPKKKNGLLSVVEKLRDPNTFSKSINSFKNEIVKVYLPKMDIVTDINLVDVLEKAGVTEVFNPKSAELKGILTTDLPVYVTDAIQKARIKVDETGTEAAVAKAASKTTLNSPLQPSPIQDFNANHPFVFCIKYQNILVFCGVYN